MDRTSFYNITNIGNGQEYDHLYNTISKFTVTYPVSYYRVTQADLMRPDMISYKNYTTVNFWWIIMVYNKVENPLTDMAVGDLLKIPALFDIYSFYKQYAFR